MRVLSDFDGTVSLKDTTDAVLKQFADPAWETLEARWIAGAMTARACMQQQVALIRASGPDLDAFLDSLDIDPGFAPFAAACEKAGIPLTIVSDGVDYFIRRILKRNELDHTPVIANALSKSGRDQWRLSAAKESQHCAAGSGVCKCDVLARDSSSPTIYIGDGRSDFCVAEEAGRIFAKTALAAHCQDKGIAFTAFQSFSDISAALAPVFNDHMLTQAQSRPDGDSVYA
jgi:2,3-diketo-5-methylthio-1-phosphopentane phosphatase